MRNTHYVEYWEYCDKKTGELIRVECPRILSVDLWNRVKAAKEKYLATRRSTNPTKHFYMLKHILRCGHCGTWLAGIYSTQQSKNHYYCPKKERMWAKNPPVAEDKWKRGRVCAMTRSLTIESTDKLVWESVIDTFSKSSLMKELIRKEVMGEGGEALKMNEKETKSRQSKIKVLEKHVRRLEDSLTDLESDRLMGNVSRAQYPRIKQRITDEKL